MKRSILFLFLALLFCACSCREPSVPPDPTIGPTAEPTSVPTPEPTEVPALPYASAVLGDEPNDETYVIAVSLYETGTNDFDGQRASWARKCPQYKMPLLDYRKCSMSRGG